MIEWSDVALIFATFALAASAFITSAIEDGDPWWWAASAIFMVCAASTISRVVKAKRRQP